MMSSLLLGYYLIFFCVIFAWPTWRIWKNHGVNALVLPKDDSAYGLIGRLFKGLIVCVFLTLTSLAFRMDLQYLGPLVWLQNEIIRFTGYALLLGSGLLIGAAQFHMGRSWRIGIDESVKTDLVSHGLFAKSRNPIFLGMRLNMLGLFMILPCAATLAIFLLSEALISIQVRLEEEHLSKTIGEQYRQYLKNTPRWV